MDHTAASLIFSLSRKVVSPRCEYDSQIYQPTHGLNCSGLQTLFIFKSQAGNSAELGCLFTSDVDLHWELRYIRAVPRKAMSSDYFLWLRQLLEWEGQHYLYRGCSSYSPAKWQQQGARYFQDHPSIGSLHDPDHRRKHKKRTGNIGFAKMNLEETKWESFYQKV